LINRLSKVIKRLSFLTNPLGVDKMFKFSKLATGCLALMVLFGCSSKSAEPVKKEDPKGAVATQAPKDAKRTSLPVEKAEVVMWNPDIATWQPLYDKLKKDFETTYPEITLKVVNIPQAAYAEKLNAAFAAGNGPDVWVNYYPTSEYARGYIESLDDYMKADTIDAKQYFQPISDLRGKGTDGKTYALPRDVSMTMIVYNKDLFDKYKVPYPKNDWTIDDFRKTAKDLTHKSDKVFGTDLINDKTLPGSPLIWNLGGDMIGDDGFKAAGLLDGEPMVKAFDLFKNVAADGSNIPSDVLDTLPKGSDNPALVTGTVGMSRLELWGYSSLKDLTFKWGVVPFPKASASSESYAWVDTVNWHMNAKSKHKNEAWAAIKYLTGKEAAAIIAKDQTWMPSNKQVWLDNGWDKDEKLGAFFAEGNKKTKISVRLRSTMYSQAINTAYKKAFKDVIFPLDGKPADAAKALKDAATEAQGIMDKAKK
jgi:multiple sugar transport system substrate-binding protein